MELGEVPSSSPCFTPLKPKRQLNLSGWQPESLFSDMPAEIASPVTPRSDYATPDASLSCNSDASGTQITLPNGIPPNVRTRDDFETPVNAFSDSIETPAAPLRPMPPRARSNISVTTIETPTRPIRQGIASSQASLPPLLDGDSASPSIDTDEDEASTQSYFQGLLTDSMLEALPLPSQEMQELMNIYHKGS